MANIPAITLLNLSEDEEKTAIVGGVSDETANGELWNGTLAELAAMQQAVSPYKVRIERTRLVSYTGADANNRPQVSSFPNTVRANNLAIRTGSTRHSFDDGYHAIEVHVLRRISTNIPNGVFVTEIDIAEFNRPESAADHLPTFAWTASVQGAGQHVQIYRVSATAFAIQNRSQSTAWFFQAIYGLKYVAYL